MNNCRVCNSNIEFRLGRGRQPKYCSESCSKIAADKLAQDRKGRLGVCKVDGCGQPANRTGLVLCEKHFGRIRRRNSLDLPEKNIPKEVTNADGYVLITGNGHPLQRGTARVFKHRAVYYEHHGAGPFSCHWCAKKVTWDDLHIDHLNDVKDDNRPENLAATCLHCNIGRGRWKSIKKLKEKTAIEFGGEKLPVKEWADRLGISVVSLKWRLKHGWPIEKALTEFRGKTGPIGNRKELAC